MKRIKIRNNNDSNSNCNGNFSLPVSAHVTVKPATSDIGSWETYTIKVPVEKNVATTKVTLKIPSAWNSNSMNQCQGGKWKSKKIVPEK